MSDVARAWLADSQDEIVGRLWSVVGAFSLCLPALVPAFFVSGHSSTPWYLWLAVVVLSCAAAAFRRWLLVGAMPPLALFLVLASPLSHATIVEGSAEMSRVQFGWPLAFIEAQLSLTPPTYPYSVRWNPLEHPSTVDAAELLASFGLVLGVLQLVPFGIAAYLKLTEPNEPPRPPAWSGTQLIRRGRGTPGGP